MTGCRPFSCVGRDLGECDHAHHAHEGVRHPGLRVREEAHQGIAPGRKLQVQRHRVAGTDDVALLLTRADEVRLVRARERVDEEGAVGVPRDRVRAPARRQAPDLAAPETMPTTWSGLAEWFSDDELDVCSACGERATLRIPDLGTTICLACGLIRRHGGETSVDAVQRQIVNDSGGLYSR